jgi:hypothetical protein
MLKKLISLFFTAILVLCLGIQSNAASVIPDYHYGNDSNQKNLITPASCTYYKFDNSYNSGIYTVRFDCNGKVDPNGSVIFSITVGKNPSESFTKVTSWQGNVPVYAIIVKGGPAYNLYKYNITPTTSDTNLTAPIVSSGKPANVSHVSIIYCPGACPTSMPTQSPTPTRTPKPTPTNTPSPTPTATPSLTPSASPTITPSATPTCAPTILPSCTPTNCTPEAICGSILFILIGLFICLMLLIIIVILICITLFNFRKKCKNDDPNCNIENVINNENNDNIVQDDLSCDTDDDQGDTNCDEDKVKSDPSSEKDKNNK